MAMQLNYSALSVASASNYESDGLHKFVVHQSGDTVLLPTSSTQNALGVLENNPASGMIAAVSYLGVTKVKVADAYVIGTFVMPEYSATTALDCGRGTDASASMLYARAVLLEASTAANQVVMCRLVDQAPAQGVTGLIGTTGVAGPAGATGVAGATGA